MQECMPDRVNGGLPRARPALVPALQSNVERVVKQRLRMNFGQALARAIATRRK